MKKILFYFQTVLLIGLFGGDFASNASAQQEDINWVFPNRISIRFDSVPIFYRTYPSWFASGISDKDGNLLFYPTIGVDNRDTTYHWEVWPYSDLRDRNKKLLANSDSIESRGQDFFPLILNDYHKAGTYHFFTLEEFTPKDSQILKRKNIHHTIRYHQIKLNEKTKNLEVIIKNQKIYKNDITLRIHAARHANGKDWWVVAHERDSSNKFIFFLIDSVGVHFHHSQNIGSIYDMNGLSFERESNSIPPPYFGFDWIGQGSFSFDGKRYAVTTWSGIIDVFDFDRCSGMFSNWRYMGMRIRDGGSHCLYGSSLSPDGSKLYVISQGYTTSPDDLTSGLWQLDLNTNPPKRYPIDTIFHQIRTEGGYRSTFFGLMQYCNPLKSVLMGLSYAGYDTLGVAFTSYLAAIKNPNLPGPLCNYELNAIELPNSAGWGGIGLLPNMPNFNLPAFPVSYFRHDTTVCEKRSFILGYDSSIDTAYRKFRWRNYSGTLRDSGMVIWGTLRHGDTLIRTMHCSTAECLLRVDTFVVKVIKTNPPCPVDREKLDFETNIKIYPNPAQEVVMIAANQRILLIRFYDMNGKVVKEEIPATSTQTFESDVQHLPHGIYLLQVETDGGSVTQKVVVE